jgi:hypothetical protein
MTEQRTHEQFRLRYEEVEAYLRNFTNPGGDPVPYDWNGVVHLVLAALDSMREHGLEVEFENIGQSMTPQQREFFLKLAEYVIADEYQDDEER